MSYAKNDQVFPGTGAATIEQKIQHAIARALRDDHQELHSAVKRIGRKTGIHPRAIRNWYEGRNTPNSLHLLMLSQHYPAVLRIILEIAGRADLCGGQLTALPLPGLADVHQGKGGEALIYGDNSITMSVALEAHIARRLNKRQLWFIGELQKREPVNAASIAATWRVPLRTGRSDIAKLVKLNIVRFAGAKRTGQYQLMSKL